MNRHHTLARVALSLTVTGLTLPASAQFPTPEVPKSDPEYIAKAKTAAPEQIANKETIIRMKDDGSSTTLQAGSNGFNCFVMSDAAPGPGGGLRSSSVVIIGAVQARVPVRLSRRGVP
jgi:hypothetical protein